MNVLRPLPAALLLLLTGSLCAAEPVDYRRDIKPILATHCYACHGPDKQRSGLRLDTAAAALKGGNSGPAVVPGKSDASRLIQAVTAAADVPVMPPKGPRLRPAEVERLRAWIDQGAAAPANEAAAAGTAGKKTHWAFVPPGRTSEPAVQNTAWVRNSIDRFILARLEKEGIAPSPEADRITLIRRLSLDLLGLPPTPREVDDFVRDDRPDAYEQLVDRLLASPHYGERWGRAWLDLARYADSNGYSIDAPRSIWPYRDWVINAFDTDKPFDQFTVEQLAGDLLPNSTQAQRVATGFHRNTQINEEGGIDLEQFRVESIIDRVNTTGSVWLGLTIGCCQCHDHKFDPVTQREYYQFFAFLNNCDEPTLELGTPDQVKEHQHISSRLKQVEKQLKGLDTTSPAGMVKWENNLTTALRELLPADIQAVLEVVENGRTEAQKEKLNAAYRKTDQARHVVAGLAGRSPLTVLAHVQVARTRAALEAERADLKKRDPVIPTTMVLRERPAPRETHILLGGDFTRKGAEVGPGVPAVLPPLRAGAKLSRLDLARWLVDPHNPLTARVAVNRMWMHHFGLGIVETENDFGTQGTPPSHPELLDYLATEFVRRGWSMKAMHRLIVTSATYRQSSKARPDLATLDPRNRLLARQSRVRLDAEFIRDGALSASGLLAEKVGGPSVFPPQPDGIYRFTQIDKHWKASSGPDRYRRGMYTYFWRSAPHPDLTVFDAPDATVACTRRNRSNVPLQALTLLNDEGYVELARGLAERVLREVNADDGERLRYAFRLCLARPPSPREQKRLAELLAQQLASGDAPMKSGTRELAAWTALARVLLNLDEFITRE
jgi:hypothetical protein